MAFVASSEKLSERVDLVLKALASAGATRAAFVAQAAALTPVAGTVVDIAGYSYRYTGTGTVIADLVGWVPVEPATPSHWGASGDLAVDQSAAVEAAMVAQVGKALFFDKLYRSDGVNLYAVHCYGTGPTTGIVSKAVKSYAGTLSGQHVVNGEGVTGFSFRNMMFDNSENTLFVSGLRTLSLYNCSDYTVDRCWFKTGGAAVASVNCSKFTVSNNSVTIQTLYTVAAVPTVQHDGVIDQWWGSNNFTISNNVIRKGNVAGKWPILVTGTTSTPVVAAKCYSFKILNNTVAGFVQAGIWTMGREGGVEDFIIHGNELDGLTDSIGHGIRISHANRFTVTDNIVYNTLGNAIRLSTEGAIVGPYHAQFGVVSGNVLSRVNAGVFTTSEGAAILVRDNFKHITIAANVVQGITHSYPLFIEGDLTSEGNLNIAGGTYPNGTMGGVIFNNSPVTSGGIWLDDAGAWNIRADATTINSATLVSKGQIQMPFGTAALPSSSFETDNDTGSYRVSANVLGRSVGGVLQDQLSAGEFAVVGATTETQVLRVGKGRTGDGRSEVALVSDVTNPSGSDLLTRYAGVNGIFEIRHNGTGPVQIVTVGAAIFLMSQNGVETMRSTPGGAFTINAVTATGTTNLASGATLSGSAKTVNIGTAGVSGSTTAITIGSTFGTTTQVNGVLTMNTYFKATPTTVAGLVAAATAGVGARHFVTDALAPAFGAAVAGGGAVAVPVYSTGAAWNVG